MGMEISVQYPSLPPNWELIQAELRNSKVNFQIRMIDQLPAFPDELPSEGWKEVRISIADGMLTIRRTENIDQVIIWGNASDQLQHAWKLMSGLLAMVGSGLVQSAPEPMSGDEFLRSHGITRRASPDSLE